MYTKTTSCPSCGESEQTCTGRPLTSGYTGEALRCCPGHSHVERRVYTDRGEGENRKLPGSAELRAVLGESVPMPPDVEQRVVAEVLHDATGKPRPERFGQSPVEAYRSLSRSRGVDLETVVRAACRGKLADVVRRPAVEEMTR